MRSCMRVIWRMWLRSSFRSLMMAVCLMLITLHIIFSKAPAHTQQQQQQQQQQDQQQQQQQHTLVVRNDAQPLIDLQKHNIDDMTLGTHADWIEVEGSNRKFFVYAAYLDRRTSDSFVRIIAITKIKIKVDACEIYLEGNKTERVTARTKPVKERWSLPYSATFILCQLPDSTTKPHRVAIVVNSNPAILSSLPIQDLSEREIMGNLSVCVKPFHYDFDRAVWLVEFIEFYRLLGVDMFIFYNHTMGRNLEAVLGYYKKQGLVTILPWSLPVISQKEIRTEGIFAALNDCNLRSVGRYRFSAMVDVDEYLIPRKHPDLLQLIDSYTDPYNVYIFQNVFFYLYWENDTAVHDSLYLDKNGLGYSLFGPEEYMPYLLTAYKTRRLSKPHKHGQRSKYLVRPEMAIEIGNHQVWDQVGSKRVLNIPSDMGFSHHYRICEFGGFECLKSKNEIDRTTHRWLIPLVKRTAEACMSIFTEQGKCPEAPPLGSPW